MPEALIRKKEELDSLSRQPNRQIPIVLLFFLLYLLAALVLQHASGIYQSELGHWPDEPSHVTTSLMIRDYLASGFPGSPIRYAENYYIHYPKVAIGMWPPVYHTVSALWMLVAGASHNSLLVFLAIQAALLATIAAVFSRCLVHPIGAFAIGLLLLCLPLSQASASTFMLELFLSILEFAAMWLLTEYLRTRTGRYAILFGVCTALAMLTKGNANCMVLLVPLMVIPAKSFWILRRPATYIAGLIIAVFGLPWQFVSMRFLQGTVPMEHISAGRFAFLFKGYLTILIKAAGWPIFLAAVVSMAATGYWLLTSKSSDTTESEKHLRLLGAASFVWAVLLFHCIAPNPGPDERYMVPALAPLLVLAAAGIIKIAELFTFLRFPLQARAAALAVIIGIFFVHSTFAIPLRAFMGLDQAAQQTIATAPGSVVLICSDSNGEGAFITSMALRERRPRHIILRGSKVLSLNPWDLTEYRPYFRDPKSLEEYFEHVGVAAVVVDRLNATWPQDRALVVQAMRNNPAKWQLTDTIERKDHPVAIDFYKWIGAPIDPAAPNNLKVNMGITLGRDLELKDNH